MKKLSAKLSVLAALALLSTTLITGCSQPASSGTSTGSAPASTPPVTTTAPASGGDTLDRIKQSGVLIVGSSNDAPFAFTDKDTGAFSGIDAEIITEVAKRLGIAKVEMKQIPFENLLLELNNKSVDMVTDGMYIKPERQKIALFTNIWYKEGEALVVLKDSTIAAVGDLKDKIIGAQKGTAFLELAQTWKDSGKVKDISIFGSQSDLLLAVKTGKIDACVTDGMVAGYSLSKDSSLNLKIVSPYTAESSGQIAASVRLSDTSFAKAVNEQIDAMKKDGTILAILKKYGMNEDYMVSVEDGQTPITAG